MNIRNMPEKRKKELAKNVIDLIAEGFKFREIAVKLNIPKGTVDCLKRVHYRINDKPNMKEVDAYYERLKPRRLKEGEITEINKFLNEADNDMLMKLR